MNAVLLITTIHISRELESYLKETLNRLEKIEQLVSAYSGKKLAGPSRSDVSALSLLPVLPSSKRMPVTQVWILPSCQLTHLLGSRRLPESLSLQVVNENLGDTQLDELLDDRFVKRFQIYPCAC